MPGRKQAQQAEYRARIAALPKVTPTTKTCRVCDQDKPADQFYKMSSSYDGLQSYCITCNKERRRGAHIQSHGLTVEQFDAMMIEQDGKCAICCEKPRRQGTVTWVIDHDHDCCPGEKSCGFCVRGLLCNPCNRAIGMLGDSVERLVSAAAYLMRGTR